MKKDIDEQISILMLKGHGDDQQECVDGFWSLEEARQDELLAHWRGQFFCNTEVYFHFFWITDTTTKSSIFFLLWSTFAPSSSCSSASKELQMTPSRATQLLDQESVGIQKIDKDHLFVTNIISFVFVKKSFSRSPLLLSFCLHGGQRLRQWQYEQERKDNLNKFFMRR